MCFHIYMPLRFLLVIGTYSYAANFYRLKDKYAAASTESLAASGPALERPADRDPGKKAVFIVIHTLFLLTSGSASRARCCP